MKLIPHHQDDKHGPREYRSPDGTWRVLRTRRPGGGRNDRPRWEVHERHESRVDGWRHHAAFERRRDALVFLDTTAAAPGNESVTTAPPKRSETPGPSQEPPQSSPRRTPKGPITHDLDETRSQDIPWFAVRRAAVRSEADRKGRQAGDLSEVSAVPVGGQLPETPSSDEGGEEDLTARPGLSARGRRLFAEPACSGSLAMSD